MAMQSTGGTGVLTVSHCSTGTNRYLDAQPRRAIEGFRLVAEFDLGDDKTAVVAGEDVHLPRAALPGNGERVFSIKPDWRGAISASASVSSRRISAFLDLMVTVASALFAMRTRVDDRSPEAR
jgi:hypothetical protein